MRRPVLACLGGLSLAMASLFACAADETESPPSGPPDPVGLPQGDASSERDGGSPSDGAPEASSACGTFGLCLLTTTKLPPLVALNAITGTSPDDIWIVGSKGVVLHGGATAFSLVPAGTGETLFSVWSVARGEAWMTSASAPLHGRRDADGGGTFERVPGTSWDDTAATSGRIWTVWGSGPNDVWLAGEPSSRFGGYASVWRLDTNGSGARTWSAASICEPNTYCSPEIRASWSAANGAAWLVGSRGENHVATSSDGGVAWASKDSRTTVSLEAVWGAPNGEAWAVGVGGTIRHYSPAAGAWVAVDSPSSSALHGVWGRSADDVWMVGDEGLVVHWNGTSLETGRVHDGATVAPDLNAVWGFDKQLWIVGNGVLFHAASVGSP